MKRVALIVGIDRYEDPAIRSLSYAVQDATELHGLLKHRARYDEVRLLRDAGEEAMLGAAEELLRGLEPGSVFLFSFSGHGLTQGGRHLLLGPRAYRRRLQYYHGTLPVDLLKDETAREGVQRVFLLDACRTNLDADKAAVAGGLEGEQVLRDVVARPAAAGVAVAPLTVLCACAEGRQAVEWPGLRQGLFSRALLDELGEALDREEEVACGEALQERLRVRMTRLAVEYRVPGEQRPWVQLSDGAAVLIPGRRAGGGGAESRGNPAAGAVGRLVKCPRDGRKNPEAGTFQCRECGEDDLCLKHLDEARGCCDRCAARLEAEEQAAAEARRVAAEAARQEAERQEAAKREAARCEQERREREAAAQRERERAAAAAEAEARRKDPSRATKEAPWENGLGMRFVPVPGTTVLFNIWATRVQDYGAFVKATGRKWEKVYFEQGPTHPAVKVSWEDAQAFCAWLTETERKAGRLAAGWRYRLPTDAEWSWAVGIGDREKGRTPQEKDMKLKDVYPWGTAWPPPKGAGNYADESWKRAYKDATIIAGYDDGYAYTSPVGSFTANRLGLYDLGGNVWEWCEDFFNGKEGSRVLRGGSWIDVDSVRLLSSFRRNGAPDSRGVNDGFRVVLGEDSAR